VAADHGESLIEHGYPLNHGRHVFETTTRVPIVVVAPGLEPARIDHPVPSWEVAPTLLALAGRPDGRSLRDELVAPFAGPIVSYTPGQESRRTFGIGGRGAEVGLRVGASKWVVARDRSWRFDLAVDPEERDPVPADDERSAQARALLDALATKPEPATTAWLQMLGYVE
jgi:choline-sulfatase